MPFSRQRALPDHAVLLVEHEQSWNGASTSTAFNPSSIPSLLAFDDDLQALLVFLFARGDPHRANVFGLLHLVGIDDER
jgi:hypothetical protein